MFMCVISGFVWVGGEGGDSSTERSNDLEQVERREIEKVPSLGRECKKKCEENIGWSSLLSALHVI